LSAGGTEGGKGDFEDPRAAAAADAAAKREAADDREATLKAMADARQMAARWDALGAASVAEEVRSGREPPLQVAATLSLMDPRDAAAALEALEAVAGCLAQARVLARLPRTFRNDLVGRIGLALGQRLVKAHPGQTPAARAVARALSTRAPAVQASVLSALDSRAAWAALQAMRPQARAGATAALSAADKARLASSVDQAQAIKFVAALAPRDAAATLQAMGAGAQAALVRAMSLDDQKYAQAALKQFAPRRGEGVESSEGQGGGSQGASETLLAMAPARRALVLQNLPPATAAEVLLTMDPAVRAGALRLVAASSQRRILDAMPPAAKADALAAMAALAAGGKSDAAGSAADDFDSDEEAEA